MQPQYKYVKKQVPFCPKCGKELLGDNSILYPYVCDCGQWHYYDGEWEIWFYNKPIKEK
jgi:hypothetical protein